MIRSVRTALSITLFIVSLTITILTLLIAYLIVDTIRNDLARNYTLMYARSVRDNIDRTMNEYIRFSKTMACSPIVRRWMAREHNPALKRMAAGEISNLRAHIYNKPGLFQAIAASRNYYFNGKYQVTMRPGRPSDSWFFEMEKKK